MHHNLEPSIATAESVSSQRSRRQPAQRFSRIACGICLLLLGLAPASFAQQVFSGSNTTEATAALNAFRAAIGGADNSTNANPQPSGRREINWDGVRLDGTDFNNNTTVIVPSKITGIPVNRFQARGVTFKDVLAVSNDGFLSANMGVANQFPAFSPANTFAPFNSNKIELSFVLPSAPTTTPAPAATRGFGVIFLDVEQANTSSIEYFNGAVSLGKFFVPAGPSAQAQFLGVLFNAPVVTRVVITVGGGQIFNFVNGQLTSGLADQTNNPNQYTDQVATDDFIYAEPVAANANTAATTFSGVGTTEATAALNAFRAAIGGADNSTNANPQPSGRREINWDGVRLDGTDFNNNTTVLVPGKITGIPVNRFQARSVLFGEVLAVSGDGFVSANPSVVNQFPAFSPANTFAPFNSNRYEVNLVLASAPTTMPVPASTRGFGVIFLDVEQANTSSIEYFNGAVSLGKFFVPPGPSGQPEFLGVLFNAPVVTRVVVTTGTAQVFNFNNGQVSSGPAESATTDLAVVDDFVYAEPVLTTASVSAASFSATALAPESITALFGVDLATGTASATTTPLPTSLVGTNVKVRDSLGNERLAPLFFVSPGQINYLVPSGTAAGNAVVIATNSTGTIGTGQIRVETVAPGLFAANSNGQGVAAAVALRVSANGQQTYEAIAKFDEPSQRFVTVPLDLGPATDSVYLILFGTGLRFRTGLQNVSVRFGNVDGQVTYAGGQTGLIGLDQVNVLIPRSLIGRGEVDVVLTVDGKTSNTVRVNIK
jgi:uncharacterized protein (TIGR03437 family)